MTSTKDFTKRVFTTSKIMTAVAIVLLVVGIGMGMIVLVGWAAKQQKATTTNQNTNSTGSSAQSNPKTSKVYTVDEVSRHNTASDCWMIIGNEVYNLTSFLDQHPGGAEAMVKYCGKDGTQAFATKDRNRGTGHSETASQMKEDYKIGTATR